MKDHKSQNCKALIMGGSLAGLLAARVLSDFYKEVTIIERDSLDTRTIGAAFHRVGMLMAFWLAGCR
jgi:2-polyprenyl-6-methoxyphenol hydroxylase-like FAD-dependent oxidoreductase